MSTAMGRIRIATSALRKCKDRMQTSATSALSLEQLFFERLDPRRE